MNRTKSQIQKEAIETWEANNYQGTICLFTGFGKTKVGVDAILKLKDKISKVLIIVPTINLKENEWPNEIEKWGKSGNIESSIADKIDIDIEVINTAHKIKEEYDLVIIDEVHTSLSPEFKAVHNIKCKYKLGLTATPPRHDKEKMRLLEEVCPVVYEKTIKEGVSLGIASPFKIYNLPVTLTRKERGKYAMWCHKFDEASKELSDYLYMCRRVGDEDGKRYKYSFDIAREVNQSKYKDHPMHEMAKKYWMAMSLRKWILYSAERKIDTITKIISKYPNKKWIIFSKSTKFVDAVVDALNDLNNKDILACGYHSKMSKKDREEVLEHFKKEDSHFNVLVSADALNQGFNLPAIDAAISAAGTSVSLTFLQRLGRTVRFKDNKEALFINLYCFNTQEEKWLRKRVEGLSSIDISSTKDI